ncbi:MAG: dihydroorotase [Hoeflea sp. BRH_c9]|nr:MAG: dihydroorotase [Hoeflea sp. BRH_c9]
MYDLVLTNGHVLDPPNGIDFNGHVAFKDGRVAALVPAECSLEGRQSVDVKGAIIAPGLIDIHTHVYWGATYLGVEADTVARAGATATLVDAGSSGAGNFAGFRRFIIEQARPRVLAFLNISQPGLFNYGINMMVEEAADYRLLSAKAAFEIADKNRDVIVGIKVRLGATESGALALGALDVALEAADWAQLPVMAHVELPPPRLGNILDRLREGDILTHCYRPRPNAAVDGLGHVKQEVLHARERGVLFDLGHGRSSFNFDVANQMLAAGFPPDVISTDIHFGNINGPVHNLLVTMSKFLCLGMPLPDVLTRVTSAAARAIGRLELGTLQIGAPADASILEIEAGSFPYQDSTGESMNGDKRLVSRGLVIGGQWIEETV